MQPPLSPHPVNLSHRHLLHRKVRGSAAAGPASTAATTAADSDDVDDSAFADESVSPSNANS